MCQSSLSVLPSLITSPFGPSFTPNLLFYHLCRCPSEISPIVSLCTCRLFVRKCSACLQVIGRSELIMRVLGQVYHLGCFSCCECERRLQRGDEFVLKEGQLLCRMDYEKEREMLAAISPTPTESGKIGFILAFHMKFKSKYFFIIVHLMKNIYPLYLWIH